MVDILQLGIIAAALQVAGYLVYGSRMLRKDIKPNGASWFMFSYGTALLLILEWDRDASFALLALPAACAVSSVFVAWYCLRQSRRAWWPEHSIEKFSFAFDVLLTITYASTWILLTKGVIDESGRDVATILILACWNVGIFTSFFPLLRQVYYHPSQERAIPWIIWSCAYGVLAIVTILEQGGFDELFLYPMINVFTHGFIAARIGFWHLSRAQPVI
jgi:hypothetical protein